MKLSKLYCNHEHFKNIEFNLNGLNVIYADVKSEPKDKKNSHDLGKTKLAELIDFMLLKNINSKQKHFLFRLKDEEGNSLFETYIFYLEILLNNGKFLTIKRSIASNSKISFSLSEKRSIGFKHNLKWIHKDIPFDKSKRILSEYLSIDFFKNKPYNFRTSINYSLRNQDDFGDVYKLSKYKGKDVQWKPFMFDLLGFNGNLLKKKYDIDAEIKEIEKIIKELKKDYTVNIEDRDQIVAEKSAIVSDFKEIEYKIDRFNFYDQDKELIRKGIDDLEIRISKLNTKSYELNFELEKLRKSIKNNFSFDIEKVKKIFEESQLYFPEQLEADYSDLITFNKQLTVERNKLLRKTISEKEKDLQTINKQLISINKEREDLLSHLTDTDTFSKFKYYQKELVKVESKLANLNQKLEIIDKIIYKENKIETLRKGIENNIQELKNSFKETENNLKYNTIRSSFRKFYKKIMNETANISWKINSKNNVEFNTPKVAFLNDSKKDSAKDEGHTYKKMLCVVFDLAILTTYNEESYYRFVYHDDVLSQQDNGIKIRLLELIDSLLKEYNLQYILSVIKSDLPVDESSEYIPFKEEDIILKLNDRDESGTLFGFEF